jgi:hypothetical protein
MDTNAFQFSRIYGQGWNVAKQLLVDSAGDLDTKKQAATLNPYRSAKERTRWSKGFEDGLLSRTGRAPAKLRSWRHTGS